MGFFLTGILIVALGVFILRQLASADIEKLARNIRRFGAAILVLVGILMALVGRWAFALPLFVGAYALIRRQLPGFSGFPGQRRSRGQTSSVRSTHLEVYLNHDTGEMDGEILDGPRAGQWLSALSLGDLLDFVREIAGDDESRTLMDTYLDRRFPGWREETERTDGTSRGKQAGPMSRKEALAILGLSKGASAEQIRSAHRRLMKKMHPDQGGSTYFASKLNEARDLLLS